MEIAFLPALCENHITLCENHITLCENHITLCENHITLCENHILVKGDAQVGMRCIHIPCSTARAIEKALVLALLLSLHNPLSPCFSFCFVFCFFLSLCRYDDEEFIFGRAPARSPSVVVLFVRFCFFWVGGGYV